jgi:hypothetical protein
MRARNIGATDQWVRIGLGTAMVTMWVFGPLGIWGIPGVYPLITGIRGVCPFYALAGISTFRPPEG